MVSFTETTLLIFHNDASAEYRAAQGPVSHLGPSSIFDDYVPIFAYDIPIDRLQYRKSRMDQVSVSSIGSHFVMAIFTRLRN
jgi:hypothetical protein